MWIRKVKFWVDESSSPTNEPMTGRGDEMSSRVPPTHSSAPLFPSLSARSGEGSTQTPERRGRPPHEGFGSGSPDFRRGVRFDDDECERGHIPMHERSPQRTPLTPRIPPEDNVPKGCSLQSMAPLREWFCRYDITCRV